LRDINDIFRGLSWSQSRMEQNYYRACVMNSASPNFDTVN